jgi:hypothetical protein
MGQSHTIERENQKKLSDLVASAKEHYAKYRGPNLFYEYVDVSHDGQDYNSVRRDAYVFARYHSRPIGNLVHLLMKSACHMRIVVCLVEKEARTEARTIQKQVEDAMNKILEPECTFVFIYIDVREPDSPTGHANILVLSKNKKVVTMNTYDPHGSYNHEIQEKYCLKLQGDFNAEMDRRGTDVSFTFSGELGCSTGIQSYTALYDIGYCSMFVLFMLDVSQKLNSLQPEEALIEAFSRAELYNIVVNWIDDMLTNFYGQDSECYLKSNTEYLSGVHGQRLLSGEHRQRLSRRTPTIDYWQHKWLRVINTLPEHKHNALKYVVLSECATSRNSLREALTRFLKVDDKHQEYGVFRIYTDNEVHNVEEAIYNMFKKGGKLEIMLRDVDRLESSTDQSEELIASENNLITIDEEEKYPEEDEIYSPITPPGTPSFKSFKTPSYTPPYTPLNTPPYTPLNTPPGTPLNTPPGTPLNTPPSTPLNTPPATPLNTPPATPPRTMPYSRILMPQYTSLDLPTYMSFDSPPHGPSDPPPFSLADPSVGDILGEKPANSLTNKRKRE